MLIQEINSTEGLAAIGPAWNRLLKDAQTGTIFQTHEWVSSWWEVYGKNGKLRVLILKEDGEIRGIAPLMLRGHKLFRRISFIGGHRADYADFIVHKNRPDDYRLFLAHLISEVKDYDQLMLENVPEPSQLLTAINSFSSDFIIRKREFDLCPYLEIGRQQEDLLRKLGKQKALKQSISKLAKAGNLTFRHYHNQEEMEESLDYLLRDYLERFDRIHLNKRLPSERAFHLQLLRRMNPKGMIRFAALELDGHPIARHFGFSYNGIYYYVRPSFDKTYSAYSPGNLLLYNLIEYAAKNGYVEFDFLRGKEPYKMRMTDKSRRVMIVNLYRSFPKLLVCLVSTKGKRFFQKFHFRQT